MQVFISRALFAKHSLLLQLHKPCNMKNDILQKTDIDGKKNTSTDNLQ